MFAEQTACQAAAWSSQHLIARKLKAQAVATRFDSMILLAFRGLWQALRKCLLALVFGRI